MTESKISRHPELSVCDNYIYSLCDTGDAVITGFTSVGRKFKNYNLFSFSFSQFRDKVYNSYHERVSFPLPGGVRRTMTNNSVSVQLSYSPDSKTDRFASLSLFLHGDTEGVLFIDIHTPEISGNSIVIPFTAEISGAQSLKMPRTSGKLALEYRQP